MSSFKYLKPESHYSELYDRGTVDECRYWENVGIKEEWGELKVDSKEAKEIELKHKMKVTVVTPTILYAVKGERYRDKSKTIAEWMNRDRLKDEKLENAKEPSNIFCTNCSSIMRAMDRTFLLDHDKNQDEVVFMFECPMCNKRKGVWEDGGEWKNKVSCEKCKGETIKESAIREGNIITTTYLCQNCGYKKEDIWNLDEKPAPEKPDPDFEKDRQRFCLSREEGQKYIEGMDHIKRTMDLIKEFTEKDKVRKQISDIKKLNIAELTQLLNKAIEKEQYIKLEFSKPEIVRDIVINFTIQDAKADRGEYDSIHQLKKAFKTNLEKTNWRLMSDGIYYRLGILSGRLRGYENDEDLLKLKQDKEKK